MNKSTVKFIIKYRETELRFGNQDISNKIEKKKLLRVTQR